jgi:hypothetical protein
MRAKRTFAAPINLTSTPNFHAWAKIDASQVDRPTRDCGRRPLQSSSRPEPRDRFLHPQACEPNIAPRERFPSLGCRAVLFLFSDHDVDLIRSRQPNSHVDTDCTYEVGHAC